MPDRELDQWAHWLLKGRQRGAPRRHNRRQESHLRKVRDGVLRDARIRPGHVVLDVGIGTGLIGLGAVPKVRPDGLVVGLDLSLDNLRACRDASDDGLQLVAGDGQRLPFRDETFDAVTTRSVLMYLEDRLEGIRELHRVLKPGGRASIFEAINRHYSAPSVSSAEPALAPIREEHERVIAYLNARSRYAERMRSFDERDLRNEFEQAGFSTVNLTLEHRLERFHVGERWEAQTFITTRPNPGTISYEEAAREVLGKDADRHLGRYAELLASGRYRLEWAVAYIAARKEM